MYEYHTGGGSFNVSNLIGIKLRPLETGKKLLFILCKMFENVQFLCICIKSLQKVVYYDPEKFPEKFNTGIKKRRILWCFKVDDVDFKIFYYKRYRQETMRILCVFVFFEIFRS